MGTIAAGRAFWSQVGLHEPLILASSSPRRATLLQAIGCPFEVVKPEVLEGAYGPWDGGEILLSRAVQKAAKVRLSFPARAILAADTVVVLDEAVLGKPADRKEAFAMLRALSGRTHEVWTALAFFLERDRSAKTALTQTMVTFSHLSPAEIQAYLETGEGLDKAGAYGIQGIAGLDPVWVSVLLRANVLRDMDGFASFI